VAEVLDPHCGVLVDADDVAGLADAARRARSLSREAARARAVSHCSLARMIDAYEGLYARLAATGAAT
jgi:hypothetical protein